MFKENLNIKKYWLTKKHEKTDWEKVAQVGNLPK
jgi:hypothetical protein